MAAAYGAPATGGGGEPPMARAHCLGGQGVLPTTWPLPMECLRGDGSPQRRWPTGWGDGEPCPVGGCCSRSACGAMAAPDGARPLTRAMSNRAQSMAAAHGASVGNGSPQR